jgi:hypothetical protein
MMLKYPIPLTTPIFAFLKKKKKKTTAPIHVHTSAGCLTVARPPVHSSAVAKSPPGLDHTAKVSSTGVGEAFHHTPCVYINISVSFRLYKNKK